MEQEEDYEEITDHCTNCDVMVVLRDSGTGKFWQHIAPSPECKAAHGMGNTEEELELRSVEALELIGNSLSQIANVMYQNVRLEKARFDREYPRKREARDAVITHRQTEEEKLRAEQGESDDDDEDWTGRREAQAIAEEQAE